MMRIVLILCLISIALPLAVFAAPIQCPYTGHWYELIQVLSTWSDAEAAAEASTYLGVPGHLVTITSAGEQAWLDDFMVSESPDNHVHVGGVQDPGAAEPDDGWAWVTGEPIVYSNWYPGEPNQNKGSNEDTMFIFAGLHAGAGQWADGLDGQLRWYVVEYDLEPVPTTPLSWGNLKGIFAQP